jgi:hypothetical protein
VRSFPGAAEHVARVLTSPVWSFLVDSS